MSLRCVACYENHKRLIELPFNCTLDDVKVAISLRFEEILDVSSSLIQVFNEEFRCYLDYDETTMLKDKDLILVTDSKRDPQQGQCRKCGAPVGMDAPQLPLQSHTTAPPPQPHHHYQAISSTAPTLQRAVQVQHAPPTEQQAAALHTFKSAADVPNTFRNRTVLWLNRDISQYTLYVPLYTGSTSYPGNLYGEAARLLVLRYGQLRDAVGYDSCSGHDFDSKRSTRGEKYTP
ncbi:uncharacterized protein LOC135375316 isoform X2 [Ornithodoros turicata]|uniref:uncharacterized protein LOC135375316 isoform X2 n=1 Tax=Ornithodoros turicata TaxID=34597 RepID=UPI003138C23B